MRLMKQQVMNRSWLVYVVFCLMHLLRKLAYNFRKSLSLNSLTMVRLVGVLSVFTKFERGLNKGGSFVMSRMRWKTGDW